MAQGYLLAQTKVGDRQDIVFGDLTNRQVGDSFTRLGAVYGNEEWVIKRIYGPEEQKLFDAIITLAGTNGFARVADLFRY